MSCPNTSSQPEIKLQLKTGYISNDPFESTNENYTFNVKASGLMV